MSSDSMMIRAFMVRLVEKAGGVDGAAAAINAATGRDVGKGTISKRMSGGAEWPLVDILALEKTLGDPCVSRWLAGAVPEVRHARSLMEAVADAAREHGEAVAAVMDAGIGQGKVSDARREVQEAVVAMARLAATLDAVDGGEE